MTKQTELTGREKLKLLVSDRPWDNEPDDAEWFDEDTKYMCQIRRNVNLSLCGYVGIPKGHPLWGVKYDDAYDNLESLTVHGGLTYSEEEEDGWWWFGFDCAHAGDLVPYSLIYNTHTRDGVYRTWEYVEREVRDLSRQLKLVENRENNLANNC